MNSVIETWPENIFDEMKSAAVVIAAGLILISAFVIISNTLNLSGKMNLSESEKLIDHFINDHKINESTFDLRNLIFKGNISHSYDSDTDIILTPHSSVFLNIEFNIFCTLPDQKSFFREKLNFLFGRKNSIFIPPENLF